MCADGGCLALPILLAGLVNLRLKRRGDVQILVVDRDKRVGLLLSSADDDLLATVCLGENGGLVASELSCTYCDHILPF